MDVLEYPQGKSRVAVLYKVRAPLVHFLVQAPLLLLKDAHLVECEVLLVMQLIEVGVMQQQLFHVVGVHHYGN